MARATSSATDRHLGGVVPTFDRITEADGLAPGTGYAHAVVTIGRTAFVSGQVAVDELGAVVGAGDMAAQARQALGNLERVLSALGATWRDVAKLGWYVTDLSQLQSVRDVRDEVMRPVLGDIPNPASTLVQVTSLVLPDLLVEVDAVVALPS
jgi:enamine deaminase RidA (YjgF/YER057c/UK114 family)